LYVVARVEELLLGSPEVLVRVQGQGVLGPVFPRADVLERGDEVVDRVELERDVLAPVGLDARPVLAVVGVVVKQPSVINKTPMGY
jgi:hypothetical protein